jgi:hypothetical protein
MTFALIQLSDIHFRQNEAENPVLAAAARLLFAGRRCCRRRRHLIRLGRRKQ